MEYRFALGERLEHCLNTRISSQGESQVLRFVDAGLPGVRGIPSTIFFCLLKRRLP